MLGLFKRKCLWEALTMGRVCFSSAISTGRLQDKVALITGGASGLGKAAAREFIKQGSHVIIADIDPETGPATASELGPNAHFIHCDVTIENQVSEAVDFAVTRHGKLDIMYNNAGVTGQPGPPGIAELDLDEFDRVMRVNVRGTVAGLKHAARVMVPARAGSIICTASISGVLGGLGPHPYTVSKSAVPGLVRSAAAELGRVGVRVNCVSPFVVATPLVLGQIGAYYPGVGRARVEEVVRGLGELAGAECEEIDVARAAVYLASDEAKYVTGHNLVIDGGFTCFKHLEFPTPDQMERK
ncbi:Sex determination protein tasselseed-2 [Acorus calamus]|uniref:Sex determination protein tasselseed-2 n=1 Tax=Acorus calamus TaxID=4465 RepID=A0AAV9C0S9_ACOCL|nr:Sex determination protein tasselseed-2 [Acorus calamus]